MHFAIDAKNRIYLFKKTYTLGGIRGSPTISGSRLGCGWGKTTLSGSGLFVCVEAVSLFACSWGVIMLFWIREPISWMLENMAATLPRRAFTSCVELKDTLVTFKSSVLYNRRVMSLWISMYKRILITTHKQTSVPLVVYFYFKKYTE